MPLFPSVEAIEAAMHPTKIEKSRFIVESKTHLVGADPEVFLTNGSKYIPAIGLIGGTKYEPRKYGIGHVQEDNVMAEFNIPPAKSPDEFDDSIKQMLDNIKSIVSPYKLDLAFVPYATFEAIELYHPQARTIGCDPDYSAWEMCKNPVIDAISMGNIRTASGHVHLSLYKPNNHPRTRIWAVKLLDLYLGVPMSLFETKDSLVRRQYYGKAGAYRPKSYGVEYRVLDNLWVKHPELRKYVYNQAAYVAELVMRKNKSPDWFSADLAYAAINKGDKRTARNCMQKTGLTFPKELEKFIQ